MRKVIFGINVTLDGNCDHTKGIADEEVHEYSRSACERLTLSSTGVKRIN